MTIAIPERMKHLPVFGGYPVPWVVQMGDGGKAHFIINDSMRVMHCAMGDLCGICGSKLLRGRWFIGGPLSAFHADGAYQDPPMHKECMEYAMRVCPYISMPNYNANKLRDRLKTPKDLGGVLLKDNTSIPGRPSFFCSVHARGTVFSSSGHFLPVKPYIAVQYWQHGKRINEQAAAVLLQEYGVIERA